MIKIKFVYINGLKFTNTLVVFFFFDYYFFSSFYLFKLEPFIDSLFIIEIISYSLTTFTIACKLIQIFKQHLNSFRHTFQIVIPININRKYSTYYLIKSC